MSKMQAISPSAAGHAPEAVTLVAPGGVPAGAVVVPDAHLLFTADFSRHGQDLVLTGQHGERFVVVDYFLADHHPEQRCLARPIGPSLCPSLGGIFAQEYSLLDQLGEFC